MPIPTMTPNTIYASIVKCLKAGLVPMIKGAPGIGKSEVNHKISTDFNLELIDLRLSQLDPTDLQGFPTKFKDSNGVEKAGYLPMDTFPIAGDPLPKGKNGWLLFLDEFNSAPQAVQKAAYKLVLDRMIGQHRLHEKVMIVCAGNREEDNAIVVRLGTAMQSRLIHMVMGVSNKEWLDWASANDIDHRVISYIGARPDNLHNFDPKHNDHTFPCPRTWHFASNLVKTEPNALSEDTITLLMGTVGEGAAREFVAFVEIYKDMHSFDDIIADPLNIPLSDEPDKQFAYSGILAEHMTDKNADMAMQFVNRMPIEFQTITLRSFLAKPNNKQFLILPPIKKWMNDNANRLF